MTKISYASAKTCKGDDSTAQENTKGWGHAHKQIKAIQTYKIQTYAK